MSPRYLPEHAEVARLTVDLVMKEASHLEFTLKRLFADHIDTQWVQDLENHPELAERIDAFSARYGRLQDTLGESLLPRFAALLGESNKSLLDVLAFAERQGWISDAESFIAARRLRNRLIHEYMTDPGQFAEALNSAQPAARALIDLANRMQQVADGLDLPQADHPTPL